MELIIAEDHVEILLFVTSLVGGQAQLVGRCRHGCYACVRIHLVLTKSKLHGIGRQLKDTTRKSFQTQEKEPNAFLFTSSSNSYNRRDEIEFSLSMAVFHSVRLREIKLLVH